MTKNVGGAYEGEPVSMIHRYATSDSVRGEGEPVSMIHRYATSLDGSRRGSEGEPVSMIHRYATSDQVSVEGEPVSMIHRYATSTDGARRISPTNGTLSEGGRFPAFQDTSSDDLISDGYGSDVSFHEGIGIDYDSSSDYVPSDSEDSEGSIHGSRYSCGISQPSNLGPARLDSNAFGTNGKFHDSFEFLPESTSSGIGRFFIIDDGNISKLRCLVTNRRVKFTEMEKMVFVETRSLQAPSLSNHCHDCMIAFQTSRRDHWRFGVIDRLQYRVKRRNDGEMTPWVLVVYEWHTIARPKSIDHKVVPRFLSKRFHRNWDDIKSDFKLRTIQCGDYPEFRLCYINQAMGREFHRGRRDDTTSGLQVQSSPAGPDRLTDERAADKVPGCPISEKLPTVHPRTISVDRSLDYFKFNFKGKVITNRFHRKTSVLDIEHVLVRDWMKAKFHVMNSELDCNYCVVDSSLGNVFEMMQERIHESDKSYLVPSLISRDDHGCSSRYFHYVPTCNYGSLFSELDGMSFDSESFEAAVEEIIKKHSNGKGMRCLVTNCNQDGNFITSTTYAGGSAPPVDGWNVRAKGCLNRTLCMTRGKVGDYPSSSPITTTYMSIKAHSRRFDRTDLDLIEKAVTKKGSCHKRSRQGLHRGSLSYLGKRSDAVVTRASPLESKESLSKYQYNSQRSNYIFFPYVMKMMNHVAMNTLNLCTGFFLYYKLTDLLIKNFMFVADMVILTIDFANSNHVDSGDCRPNLVTLMDNELDEVIRHQRTTFTVKRSAKNTRAFVRETKCAIPTTCGYQIVPTGSDEDLDQINTHYFFVNSGIGTAYKIYDRMTMTFCGSVFQHCTSLPLFTETDSEGKVVVRVGRHPKMNFLAWGGTSTQKKNATTASKRGRKKRKRSN